MSENQRKRDDKQLLEPCQRTKKAVEPEGEGDTNCNWCSWNGSQRLGKGSGRVGNRRMSRDHPNYCIVKITQNTSKSPGENYCQSDSCEKPSVKGGVKILKGINDNNNPK